MEYFAEASNPSLKADANELMRELWRCASHDNDTTTADFFARAYYKRGGMPVWIHRNGITPQADTLVAFLDTINADGFNLPHSQLESLRSALKDARNLNHADSTATCERICKTLAHIEYQLTKGLLKYGVGLHYGVTNPRKLLSKLDIRDSDSIRVTYRELYDIPVHIAGSKTMTWAMTLPEKDSVGWFLRDAQPTNPLYARLKSMLPTAVGAKRAKILVNMERARWRTPDAPAKHEEYVFVNIPAYHLWAVNKEEQIDMRIGCGSRKTKTPLLHSNIERMDLNPQWVIPGSIVSKEVINHAGDGEYFLSHRYFAQHRKTGKKLYGYDITYSALASNEYYVIQQGGVGNSLGRIIFRFPNNFAVYLHDTSSRSFFARDDRSVSHGCVRVERPYDLAEFLLREADKDKAERIKYSMETDISADDVDKSKLISSVRLDPHVPIFIEYYTMFLTPDGRIESYPDVYGYDEVMMQYLNI